MSSRIQQKDFSPSETQQSQTHLQNLLMKKLYNYEVQITVQAIWVYALGIIETVRRQYVICHRKTDNYWTDTSPTDSHNLHLVRYSIHLTAFRTVFEWLRRIFLIRKGNSCTTLSSHNTRQGSTSSKLAEQIPFV
jgi:hypothetical protein